eukprot:g9459.t1
MKRQALLLWSSIVVSASAASVAWNADSVQISLTSSGTEYHLQLGASRRVLPSADVGHFNLSVTRGGVSFVTSCISYGASAVEVAAALDALDPIDDLGGSTVVRQGDGLTPAYSYGFVYYISASESSQNLVTSLGIQVAGSGVESGCARLSTLGYWEDGLNWDTGVAPASTDDVTVPVDSGFVALTADITVSSLQIRGGALVTHDTTCLPGWTAAPGGTSSSFGSSKCYRVFDDAAPWAEAQTACASAVSPQHTGIPRSGALRGALVAVQDQDENSWISRMCRGDSLERDCWLGMTRSNRGVDGEEMGDDLEWAGLWQLVGGSRYRSWAVREPSDFQGDEAGENCVAIRGSKRRAAEQEEARWYDDECGSAKPFVCQAFGISNPFSLTVSTELKLAGGYIVGAGTVVSSALAQVTGDDGQVGILNGATLLNSASGSMEWSAPSAVGWGGTLRNLGALTLNGAAVSLRTAEDEAGFLPDNAGPWPALVNAEGAQVVVGADSGVYLEWLLLNKGGSVVVRGALDSTGGGYSSSGTLTVDEGGKASFKGSSFIMHQSAVVVLTIQADREVTGQNVETSAEAAGYYRLAFGGEETSCIGYHATEDTVQEALEQLSSIGAEGGVTVRRDGDGKLMRWQHGYRFVVTFDGARSLSGGDVLAVSCAGSANGCGCVDVTGPLSGPRAVGCGKAGSADDNASTSAEFDSSACLVRAAVELETLRGGGETVVNGGGTLSFSDGGQYLLPSTVAADVEVMGKAEVVCPQRAAELVGAVNVSSGGVLWFAGADWDALDAVHLLHSDPHTPGRAGGAVASPPVFSVTVSGDVNVQNNGEIRLAATQSAALKVVGSLTLAGGGLSGQGRVEVEGSTLVVGSAISSDGDVGVGGASSLKNGVTLDMYGGGAWTGGGLQARDGVSVVNRGQLWLSADNGTWFGHGGDFGVKEALDFDGERWYANPLCGESCKMEPWWENVEGGEVVAAANSRTVLGFSLINEGTVRVEDGGHLEWCAVRRGGGNGSMVLPGVNSTNVFSDGGFVFGSNAVLTGEGVLEFSGGTGHELPTNTNEVVFPLVKVSGHGVVTVAGGGGGDISFGRGLTVVDNGAIVFSSPTSSTSVSGDVTLTDDGLIAFPPPGVHESLVVAGGGGVEAEAPWGRGEGDLDGGGGWGAASRSSLTVEGKFFWGGGAISGNARVICAGESEWSSSSEAASTSTTTSRSTSTKKLLNSLHLVSRGAIVWSTGDVVVSLGAAFVNQGTLLLLEQRDPEDGLRLDPTPRIRGPRKGEEVGWGGTLPSAAMEALALVDGASVVAIGGAGSEEGGQWAWEELNYDGFV